MAAKTLIDEAGGRGEGANVPEGNFDNEEIYPLPPSSPLVSNSPQDLMSWSIPHTPMYPSLETFERWPFKNWFASFFLKT